MLRRLTHKAVSDFREGVCVCVCAGVLMCKGYLYAGNKDQDKAEPQTLVYHAPLLAIGLREILPGIHWTPT